MPNRRRRRLSTTMSAVAALAVASPFAIVAFSELAAGSSASSAPQHHEFVRASSVADLPGELISALTQGLSQFGVNLPPAPTGIGGSGVPAATPGLTSPGLSPGLTSPGLSPGLTSPGLTSPGLTSPGLSPSLTSPGQTTPGLTTPGLTTPGMSPSLTDPSLSNPALTNPAGMVPGLTSPAGADPSLPGSDGTGLMSPSELPISAAGYDPGLDGTYPILGDPSLGAMPTGDTGGGSGGIVSDLMSAANQLGAGQAIDLLKSMVIPSIMQAAQNAAAPAAAAPAAAAPAVADAAAGAATAAAGA